MDTLGARAALNDHSRSPKNLETRKSAGAITSKRWQEAARCRSLPSL